MTAPDLPGATIDFQAVLEAAPDAMIIAGADGRIVLANAQATVLFRYTREELVGQPVELLVPDQFRAGHPKLREGYVHDPRTRPMAAGLKLSGRRKDGSEFPAEISLAPVRGAGPVYVIAAIRDVTDKVRMEEERQRRAQADLEAENRRMQEASRLKSEFLANMSHELRTPLNAIIGFAELMHDGKVGAVSPDHKEYLGDILTSARHLLRMINDVLDLAKVEAGRMEFHVEPLDLNLVVGEVRDILRGLASERGVTVAVDVDPGLTDIRLDANRLKQVLYNFLSNAIKFTAAAGRVTVRVRADGVEWWRLEVEDTGVGIKPEQMNLLFNEFARIDAGAERAQQGAGLGLALTKRVVEAQGGHVQAESRPGRGSVFVAVLPRIWHGGDG